MPNEDENFEELLKRSFKELDAQLKIPEIPDAQAIFEAKESKKGIVHSFRAVRIVAAAAVVLVVGLSAFAIGEKLGVSQEKALLQMADFAPQERASQSTPLNEISEEEIPYSQEPIAEEPVEAYSIQPIVPPGESINGEVFVSNGNEDDWKQASGYSLDQSLRIFFYSDISGSGTEKSLPYATDFSDILSNKRSISVDIDTDSVSVTLYDTSGEEEILSAFWVEGKFLSGKQKEDEYLLVIEKKIMQKEFESGNYLPLIGDAQKGTEELSESCISVEETISEGVIRMTVCLNIEKGTYTIKAVLK